MTLFELRLNGSWKKALDSLVKIKAANQRGRLPVPPDLQYIGSEYKDL